VLGTIKPREGKRAGPDPFREPKKEAKIDRTLLDEKEKPSTVSGEGIEFGVGAKSRSKKTITSVEPS